MEQQATNYQKPSRNSEKKKPLDPTIYGKVPPQAVEMEKAVLGTIMVDEQSFEASQELLKENYFYSKDHQVIYQAMSRISDKHQRIDALTLGEELLKMNELENVGGQAYLAGLTNHFTGVTIIPKARIILEKFLLREVIRIGSEMVAEGFTDSTDAFELIEQAEKSILSIRSNNVRKPFKSLTAGMVEAYKEIEKNRHRKQHLTGVSSGFKDVDMITCGWQNTDLIIVAARPSVGKTAFALNLARNAAMNPENPVPVAVFSLEMKDTQLINRMLSAESGLWLWKLRNSDMDEEQMKELFIKGMGPLSKAEIWIDDTPSLNISEFRSKSLQLVQKHKVGMIIVDYLQLMTVSGVNNREQQISFISRQLKSIAKELNVPIIALSQLSRSVEQRGGEKEPKLSDLRESGAIEQDADMVMFLWRPTDEEIAQDISLTGVCHVKIEKNRNGSLAKFLGEFQKEIQRWNFLKVVDGALKPIGSNWKPVQTAVIDFTEPSKKAEELPF